MGGGENLLFNKSVNETCDDLLIFLKTALVSTEQEEEGTEGARSQTAATAVSLAVSRCENHELRKRLLCKSWKPQWVCVRAKQLYGLSIFGSGDTPTQTEASS